jgi:hypothetical protein
MKTYGFQTFPYLVYKDSLIIKLSDFRLVYRFLINLAIMVAALTFMLRYCAQATRLYLFGQEACGYLFVSLQYYYGITLLAVSLL